MKLLLWTGLLVLLRSSKARVVQQQTFCPDECFCPPNFEINCNDKHLSAVPVVGDEANEFVSYDLSGNNIEQIPATAFDTLGQLKYMDLRSTGLKRVAMLGFYGLDNLQRLHLDNNSLTSLHRGTFQLLESLQTLTLSRNPLDISQSIPFSHTLKKLDIGSCQLQAISPDFLAGVTHLQELILTNNSLQSLPVDFFINLPKLKRLYLHGNPWRCDVVEDLLLSNQDVIVDYKKVLCWTSDDEQRELSWKPTQTTRVSSSSQQPRATSPGAYLSSGVANRQLTSTGIKYSGSAGSKIINKDEVDEITIASDEAYSQSIYVLVCVLAAFLLLILISIVVVVYRRKMRIHV